MSPSHSDNIWDMWASRWHDDERLTVICRYAYAHEERVPKYVKEQVYCCWPECAECGHSKPHKMDQGTSGCGYKPECIDIDRYSKIIREKPKRKIFRKHMFTKKDFEL